MPHRLEERDCIVLERLANGAGATNWYMLHRPDELPDLAKRLRRGSLVTFCFAGFSEATVEDAPTQAILAIAGTDGDAVLAARTPALELRVDYVSNTDDLSALLAELEPRETFSFGAFPMRVTMALPKRS